MVEEIGKSQEAKKLDMSKTIMVKGKPLSIRGAVKEGIVVSTKAKNTAIVQRDYFIYNHKYKRKERRKSRIPCHNIIDAKVGDKVKIAETRRISKTKSWIIIEILGKGRLKEKSEDATKN